VVCGLRKDKYLYITVAEVVEAVAANVEAVTAASSAVNSQLDLHTVTASSAA